jgi:hypothetical protein
MAIWRMRIACRIPKATNTHLEYVIIIAFPLQRWLPEPFSVLHYRYSRLIVCGFRRVCHIVSRSDFRTKFSPPVNKMSLVSCVVITSLLQGDSPVLFYQFINSVDTMLLQLTSGHCLVEENRL